jgi:hypothetical protein
MPFVVGLEKREGNGLEMKEDVAAYIFFYLSSYAY